MDLDEEIYAWSRGLLVTEDEPPVAGVLVATHRRVCFFGVSRLRRGAHFEEIAMQSLVGVSGDNGSGRILVDGNAGTRIEFVARRRADRDDLIAAVQQAHDEWQHAEEDADADTIEGAAVAPPPSDDQPAIDPSLAASQSASSDASSAAVAEGSEASDEHAADARNGSSVATPTEFPGVTYIRGVPGSFDPTRGILWVDSEAVCFGDEGKASITIELRSITSVEVISDIRFLPSGERNRGAVARSMSNAGPATSPASVQAVTRRQEITTWYLSIGYLATGGTFEALFSVASWNSARQKAYEIRNLILTRREEAGFQMPNASGTEAASLDSRARLVELRNLYEAQLISAEEYEAKRREILDRL